MFVNGSRALAIGVALALLPNMSPAQDFPAREITMVVPFPAGGPTDIIARLLGNTIGKQISKPVVVLNIGGAGGTIGATRAATAQPDGHTLLMASSAQLVLAPYVFSNVAYNGLEAFEPIGLITRVPLVLQVPAASKYKSLTELLDYGRSNPGTLNIANVGLGTIQHVVIELLLTKAGVKALQIPYKGSAPATTAFLSGEVDFMIDLPSAVAPLVDGNKSRALAIFSSERIAELKDVPTARELGLDFEAYTWFAIMAPKGTPPERLAFLREQLATALASDEVKARMKSTGFPTSPVPLADFSAMMKSEAARYKAVVEAAGIKAE